MTQEEYELFKFFGGEKRRPVPAQQIGGAYD